MLRITFNTDGATFLDSDGNEDPGIKRLEVADHLERIAEKIRDGHSEANVLDTNGNTIGSWSLD